MGNKNIDVRLIKSLIGSKSYQRNSVKGLGLTKIGQVVSVLDTPENRGMIKVINHMVEINI